VLQCVAVCVAVAYSVWCLHEIDVHDILPCVAVCCSVLQCFAVFGSVLQCVAVCCSVLQRTVLCCHALQCVAVCCSVLQWLIVCGVCMEATHMIFFRCRYARRIHVLCIHINILCTNTYIYM